MIGVDIIDLKAILSRSDEKLKRYRNRIMSVKEQRILDRWFDYELVPLLAWCVKECVYKLEYKVKAHRVFAPKSMLLKSIECQQDCLFQVVVDARLSQYEVQLNLKEAFIYSMAIASPKSNSKTYFHSFQIENNPAKASIMCRMQLNNFLKKEFSDTSFSIETREYPKLVAENGKYFDLSISHHGQWGCFALETVQV